MSAPSLDGVRHIEVDGLRLRVAVTGAGRPLLLVAGLGASLDLWRPFERALAGRVQTISYDAPGTGGSERYPRPRRLPGLARTAERLLDALGHDRVDVLGVSFGGAVAQELAHRAPHRVRRLVLAATAPGLGGIPGHPRALIALATPRRYYSPAYFRRVAPDLYGGAARRNPDAVTMHESARFLRPPSPRGYLDQLWAITGWSSLPYLHRLRQRTLVLAGDDDPIIPLVNGRILASRLPNAHLHVLRGGGHLFLLEQAPETADLVAGFLAEPD